LEQMKKILVIDSHKSSDDSDQQNLHWLNGKIISDHLNAKYIWSYPRMNDVIDNDLSIIIFNHASNYSQESDGWLTKNPTAKLFYVCNDYNLGEPITLWRYAKDNDKQYHIIVNHYSTKSKITKKYVGDWNVVNLNSLIIDPKVYTKENEFFEGDLYKFEFVYYGTFRKDRINGFKKYLKGEVILSTHSTNIRDFKKLGCKFFCRDRIDWSDGVGLFEYKYSLCIEDDTTYTNYSHLPNRFYEALNYDVIPVFDKQSKNNVELAGYKIPDYLFVDSYEELVALKDLAFDYSLMEEWKEQAMKEKQETLNQIENIVLRDYK